ncbi:Acyl-CoA dehydrogenase/oxidase C-terminal [Trinorchestia longiramus]|nr:Acyl-CoA dehydrogenase/oxidase C-terminal [Trinorchestia longiramus]
MSLSGEYFSLGTTSRTIIEVEWHCVRLPPKLRMLASRALLLATPRAIAAQAFPSSVSLRCQSTAAEPQSTNKAAPKSAPQASPSFVKNIFCGKIVTDQLLPYPNFLTQEQNENLGMLVDPARKFFQEVNDATKNDVNEGVDEETLQGLKDMGCFGLQVPPEYGGLGCNNTMYARLVEIVGEHDLGVGIVLGAHQSIGFKGILICGNKEQKEKYLPVVASGEHFAAFALTEPSSGSDANSIKSRAVPSEDGSHYILNGSKIWISNGGFAEIFTVFAQTPVKDERTGEMVDKVTAFIVERGFGGVTSGPPEKKMGIKCSNTAEVYFDNVKIPAENVLGEVGHGFKVAMEILNNGRFGMAAAMTGAIRSSMAKAVDFASNRNQFGRKIHEFGSIQEKLARMAMLHYASESLAYMISSNMDGGSKEYHLEAAISKVYCSEAAWWVTDEAIQVMGGMGFMKETGLERVMRDLRIFRIFEGTNDILRLFVALTGLQYAGTNLRAIQIAIKNPAANLGMIIDEGSKRAIRAIGFSNTGVLPGVHPELAKQAADIAKTVGEFGTACESLLIKHGNSIVEQQFPLNRIAQSAVDLYSSAAVVSRATKSLELNFPSAKHEKKIAQVFINEACSRTRHNLKIARSSDAHQDFERMASISKDIIENGGLISSRALGL